MRRSSHSILRPWKFLQAAAKQARHILRYKLLYLAAEKHGSIYFYPETPHPYTIAYKVLHLSGIRIAAGLPRKSPDAGVSPVMIFCWEDSTVSRHARPVSPPISKDVLHVNVACRDISKSLVGEVHSRVFGYQAEVDPLKHTGPLVAKSNENGTHSGEIVRGPLKEARLGWVYQRLIENTSEGLALLGAGPGMAVDFRVPVFGRAWRHSYIKYRSLTSRFSNTNDKVEIVDTAALFSRSEIEKLNEFCKSIGLDYGELDVVRDAASKQIFVLDVNKTPLGPPNGLSDTDSEIALNAYKTAFLDFISRAPKTAFAARGNYAA